VRSRKARWLGLAMTIMLILAVARLVFMTRSGQITWLLPSSAVLTLDSDEVEGRTLVSNDGRLIIVVLSDGRGSYWVALPQQVPVAKPGLVYWCDWRPRAFLPTLINSANPPCWQSTETEAGISLNADRQPRFTLSELEFLTNDHRRLRVKR